MVHEHRIKERVSGHVPFDVYFFYKLFKRIILVFISLKRVFFYLLQIMSESLFPFRMVSDRQGIDKHADEILNILMISTCSRCPDDDIFLTCIFGKQCCITGQQKHVHRNTVFFRHMLKLAECFTFNCCSDGVTFRAFCQRPFMICREIKDRDIAFIRLQPVFFLSFQLIAASMAFFPFCVIFILNMEWLQ
ncbi:hypothetical protein CHCC20375_2450 [Bacillus licheniformis]|nr:hypothetical protein CHCC20375_2450 [Bacillus licheniformis]